MEPPADIVRRDDPVLFAAAMFAPEPARGRLITLAGLDIELSRAGQRADTTEAGPPIARMRLQWWRDRLAAAGAGEALPAHEVAGPLSALISQGHLEAAALEPLIAAREMELEAPLGEAELAAWADARFGAYLFAALELLGQTGEAVGRAAEAGGRAMGQGFLLRTALPMAAAGEGMLPLEPGDRAALISRDVDATLAERFMAIARQGRAALDRAETAARALPRRALPALMPLTRDARTLRMVLDAGGRIGNESLSGSGAGEGIRMLPAWVLRRF